MSPQAAVLPFPAWLACHVPGVRPGLVLRPCGDGMRAPGAGRSQWFQCVDECARDGWEAVLAPSVLCESELRIWRALPRPARRRQWLRGRLAAKVAVRLLLQACRLTVPMGAIVVLPNERGQPCVACLPGPGSDAGVRVSISHCGNTSTALAAQDCEGIGIDVESPADDHEGLEQGAFEPVETADLDGCCAAHERELWLLRAWCAKEAASKAMGLGLMGDPQNYVVKRIDRARGTVLIEAFAHGSVAGPSPERFTVQTGFDRGLIFAAAQQGRP